MINLASINLIGEKWNVIIYSLMSRKVGLYWTRLICVSFISQPCLLTRFSVTHSASAVAEAKGPHTSSCCCCLVAKSCPTFVWLHRLWPTRLLCPWDFPGKNTEWVAISFSRGSSPPRDPPFISCIAGGFFASEPLGEPIHIYVCMYSFSDLFYYVHLAFISPK